MLTTLKLISTNHSRLTYKWLRRIILKHSSIQLHTELHQLVNYNASNSDWTIILLHDLDQQLV